MSMVPLETGVDSGIAFRPSRQRPVRTKSIYVLD